MKKEDYQSLAQGTPIDIIFIPEGVQAQFREKVKLQVAFYRNSKVIKSTPLKFLKSNSTNNKINLQPQQLPFCTTINYNDFHHTFQSKIINVQLAIQIDGEKSVHDSRIDLKDILIDKTEYQRSNLIVHFKNNLKLFYGIKTKLINQTNLGNYQITSMKTLADKSPKKYPEFEPQIPEKKTHNKARAINFNIPDQKQNDDNRIQNVSKTARNFRSQKIIRQMQSETDTEMYLKIQKSLQQKLKQVNKKFDQAIQENNQLKKKLKHSENMNEQKQKQINQMDKLLKRLSEQKNKLLNQSPKNKNNQDQIIKKNLQIERLQNINNDRQKQINQLQRRVKKLTQQLRDYSNQFNKKNNDQTLNRKNQLIQKLNDEIQNLKDINQDQKSKYQDIRRNQVQFRSKYQQSEKKNVKLTSEISQAHYTIQKLERQVEKLTKKIDKLEKQIGDNSLLQQNPKATVVDQKILKQKDLQISKLTKLIETKEEMIKILKKDTQMKKNQQDEDITFMKKQNKQLKQEIEKLKQGKKDSTSIQLKVMNQKLKKQCQQAKREEKKMMSQKAQIQNRNKQKHEQIVRLKESIAKILNIVQEEGSSDLFTQVADCLT